MESRLSMYITLVSINGKVDYPCILHLFLSIGRSTIYLYYTCFYFWIGRLSMYTTLVSINWKVDYRCILLYTCFYQCEGRLSIYITLGSINGKVDYPCILHLFLSMGRSIIHVSMYITLVSINGKSTIHVYYTCFYH